MDGAAVLEVGEGVDDITVRLANPGDGDEDGDVD